MIATEREKSSRFNVWMKKFYSHASQPFIPTTIVNEGNQDGITGSEKAKKLLADGRGLVIIYTHPSRSDTHRLMGLWRDSEYAESNCLIPIATHQFNLVAKISAWPPGIEFHEIVTRETINRGKNNGHEEGYGTKDFLEAAIKKIAKGAVVLLAPTATRTSQLTLPGGIQPTDTLLNLTHRRNIPFAVMATGFEISGVTSYENSSGLNLFKRYILRTGNTYTDDELLEQLERFRTERGLQADFRRPFNDTYLWLFETQLPSLVAPAYLP